MWQLYKWNTLVMQSWTSSYTTVSVTLESANWSWWTQTVTVSWVTSSNTVLVSPDPSSFSDYTDAVIYCSAQWTNILTFTCDSEPTVDITVNVTILK